MTQMNFLSHQTWSVSDITKYLRNLINQDDTLNEVWVLGEISNISRPSSGHLYFTLKDENASLRCVMWRNNVNIQKWLPKEGDAIEIRGSIDIYEAGGSYQLYVDLIQPVGEGFLYQNFIKLKSKLNKEGLFDLEIKKPIPKFPKLIGIITSRTGAAIRDILTTIQRRYPIVEVVIAPTPVQGEQAATSIVSAIKSLEVQVKPDVIILARGGGSIEDLWSFNEEKVARAIVDCSIPIITGIGHETDFTIADFVSDLRAPTPTAAAELATPSQDDIKTRISEYILQISISIREKILILRSKLENFEDRFVYLSPLMKLRNDRQRLDEYSHYLLTNEIRNIKMHRITLETYKQKLISLNPSAILKRGYSVVTNVQGEIIKFVNQVKASDKIDIQISDGKFSARVE